jgi:hypothetical protein
MITDISLLGSDSNRFITTGDNGSKIWDIPSKKMIAEITNPNDPRTTVCHLTFYHQRSSRILQVSTSGLINLYSYPSLKLIKSEKIFGDILYHPNWDFWLYADSGMLYIKDISQGNLIESKKFETEITEAGFSEDSSFVFYKAETDSIAFAPVDNPTNLSWKVFNKKEIGQIEKCITPELFIVIQNSLDEDGKDKFSKTRSFYCRNKLIPLDTLITSTENGAYCKKNQTYYFSTAYIKSAEKLFAFSLKEEKIVSNFGSSATGNKNRIRQITVDECNNLLWVSNEQSIKAYDIFDASLKQELPYKNTDMFRILNCETMIVEEDQNLTIVRNLLNNPKKQPLKADFGESVLESKIIDGDLYTITGSEVLRINLQNLISYKPILLPEKKKSQNTLSAYFHFWEGYYGFTENRKETLCHFENDSLKTIEAKFLAFDHRINSLYYLRNDTIMEVNVFENIDKARQKGVIVLDSSYYYTKTAYDYKTKRVYSLRYRERIKNSKERFNKLYNEITDNRPPLLTLEIWSLEKRQLITYDLSSNTSGALLSDEGYLLITELVEHQSTSKDSSSLRRRRRNFENKDLKIFKITNDGLNQVGHLTGLYDLDDLRSVYFKNGNLLLTTDYSFFLYDVMSKKTTQLVSGKEKNENYDFNKYTYNYDKNQVLCNGFLGYNVVVDLTDKKIIQSFKAHPWLQNSSGFSPYSGYYTSSDQEIKFWNNGGHCVFSFYFNNKGGYLLKDSSGYYFATKNAIKDLHYIDSNLNLICFDQLDPVFNRPGVVLQEVCEYLGSSNPSLVAIYSEATYKRNKQLGISISEDRNERIVLPTASIINNKSFGARTSKENFSFKIVANDLKHSLIRYNIYVNEVPVYGSLGVPLNKNTNSIERDIEIKLTEGENKIQVSVMNDLGLENFRYPLYIEYVPNKPILSKTVFIGIGVNEFIDKSHNLKYCVKDVEDLAKRFSGPNTVIKLFSNKQVTRENILDLKNYLIKNTTVNDKVIISCSSHGLLDDSLNFYLAMHDVDFENPRERGLKYEELESLLDGIPARQKLLLLDACNSGENDKTEVLRNELKQKQASMDSAQILAARGIIIQLEEENKNTFKKINELFVNVRNNTGSVIISAAGGQESALEAIRVNGTTIHNGAFTYSVLECMELYNGKELKVNTLKQYTEKRVEEITTGKQKPTSRQETMEINWSIY